MSEKELYAVGIVLLIAVVFSLVYFASGGQIPQVPQSIIPSGVGGVYQAVPGSTETWATALDSVTGQAIMSALGCSQNSGVPVSITRHSDLKCKNSAGQYVYQTVTETSTPTTMQCNVFQGQSSSFSANLVGQSSAVISSNTILGSDSCFIYVEYTGIGNGHTYTINDLTVDYRGKPVSIVAPPTPTCNSGSTTCSGSNVLTCSNSVYSFSQGCPVGCSNGACLTECSPNSILCVGNANYKLCGSNGIYGSVVAINGGTCQNGVITPTVPPTPAYKTCPDGSQVLQTAACPTYCGDGMCNSNENPNSCLTDCPIAPVPANNSTSCTVNQVKCESINSYRLCGLGQVWSDPIDMGSTGTCVNGYLTQTITPLLPPATNNTILYIIGGVFIAIIGLIIYFAVKKD